MNKKNVLESMTKLKYYILRDQIENDLQKKRRQIDYRRKPNKIIEHGSQQQEAKYLYQHAFRGSL